MDSRLDSFFKTRLRHTEAVDTRQAIRRQEQPDGRARKDGGAKKEKDQDLWEDQTTVSIRALKAFLHQLVSPSALASETPASPAKPSKNTPRTGTTAPAPRQASSPKAAQAAHAYQRTYRATHSSENENHPPVATGEAAEIDLSPEETRVIHGLISDLEKLERQDVDYLQIQKSDSFLQSLVNAVKAHATPG